MIKDVVSKVDAGTPDRYGTKQKVKDTIAYTVCGHHCTNEGDLLKVRMRNGKIMTIEPDDTINRNMPREDTHLSQQWLDKCMLQMRPCPKAYAAVRMLYDPKRLLYPMKRVGAKGEGKFERITWEEALDTIANKLQETKKKYGPYSILGSGMEGFPLNPWFGAGTGAWGSHSSQGTNEVLQWVQGIRVRAERCDEGNIFDAKLIVFWGTNRPSTLSDASTFNFLRAKERGIPIIQIEHRLNMSGEVLADQWIPIRPTTDVAMMIAMANVWLKENLCDKEYIAKYVEPEGYKKWTAYVLGQEDGVDKTPQWAEVICGVPAETITEFARLYARSKPVHLNIPLSMGRQFYGENPVRAAMYLQAMTGNATIPGGTPGGEHNGFGEHGPRTLPMPRVESGRIRGKYHVPVLGIHIRWLVAVDLREKYDSGEMTKEEYNKAIANMPGNEPPNIRMVILHQSHAIMSHPDINTNIRAFKKLDFLVDFTYFADEPSSKYADILLPQINMHWEGRDIAASGEGGGSPGGTLFHGGRNLNGNYFSYRQKCMDPPGEVRPKEWVWIELAKRLGFAEQYNPRLMNVPLEKWDEVLDEMHKEAWDKWKIRPEIAPLNPPTWEEFQKAPIFRWEVKQAYYPFKNSFDKGENPFKGTESGKIEFVNPELARGPEWLATNEFLSGTDRQPNAVLGSHASFGRWYGPGNLPAMAKMSMGGKATFFSGDTNKYPLLNSSPKSVFRIHTFLDNQPLLRDCYRHAVWINVADAKARGIRDGDLVKVYNDKAEMILPAYVTSRTVPGSTSIFHGAWYTPGKAKSTKMPDGIDMRGAPNLLNDVMEHLPDTVINHQPDKGLVEIVKWEG